MEAIALHRDNPSYAESLRSWYGMIPARVGEAENHRVAEDEKMAFFIVDLRQSSVPTSHLTPQDWQLIQQEYPGIDRARIRDVPQLEYYCLDAFGKAAQVTSIGQFPYFYVAPRNAHPDLMAIRTALNSYCEPVLQGNQAVMKIEIVRKESLMGYRGDHCLENILKITLSSQSVLPRCRELCRKGDCAGLSNRVFEGNIPMDLRFMIDLGLAGCAWFKAPRKRHTAVKSDKVVEELVAGANVAGSLPSRTPLIDTYSNIHYTEFEVLDMEEGQWSGIPNQLRTLSFDIECTTLGRKGFPKASLDPVIQISLVMKEFGGAILNKSVLCLKETAPLSDGTIVWFDKEDDLLLAFAEYVRLSDPDIITGYNCFNFDLNYLLDRAEALNIKEKFGYLSRIPGYQSQAEDKRLASKGLGIKEYKNIEIPGRVCLDVLEAIRKEHKLKSYSLNAVSAHFLNNQKEDVDYSIIGDLFSGTPETRKRIASYCLKDSILPIDLMDKLLLLVNMVEMARVTGVPINYLITRGQQIKVTSQILRHCKTTNYLMPMIDRSNGGDDKYEGATVLEPKKAFYTQPITTLDFASLYPSIMIAHNLCYSTLVEPHNRSSVMPGLNEMDYTKAPQGDTFVKSSVRQGILPTIVDNLIKARKKARKMMAQETDPLTKKVLNGRQLALKISANSVYGYTGAASAGQLPCLPVSTAITAFGRQMIDKTKEVVESHYTIANGYAANADVVYGDTDSVMVDFGVKTVADGMKFGEEAAQLVTEQFVSPIKLEFEKVFCPYLLMAKKRYAGLYFASNPDTPDKMDCKGIETVRRDFCDLVQISVDTVLRKILYDRDIEGAKNFVRDTIAKLMTNQVDMSLLVMTKSIGKEDYSAKVAHVELAKRMRIRDPGNAPQVGDRVHYVIIAGSKAAKQHERAEDPLYVLDNNISLDTSYYLDCLNKPLCRILEPCIPSSEGGPEALFKGGAHTMKKVKSFSTGALSKFMTTKKILRCLGCRVTLKPDVKGQLCPSCDEKKGADVTVEAYRKLGTLQKEFNELWTQCQNCQGSVLQDVICTSRDCPIYYRRTKVRMDVGKVEDELWGLYEEW